MNIIYLLNYSVKGIKELEEKVSLSFYKKTIKLPLNTEKYNVKGIYGVNGSGKSGIIASVEILKNLLLNSEYLSNPIVQKNLDALINKKTKELMIEVDYLFQSNPNPMIFRYKIVLSKDENKVGKYVISFEELSRKKATSKKDEMEKIFTSENGKITFLKKTGLFNDLILQKTANLLETSSITPLFFEKILTPLYLENEQIPQFLSENLPFFMEYVINRIFGKSLFIYLDSADEHRDFFIQDSLKEIDDEEKMVLKFSEFQKDFSGINAIKMDMITVSDNLIPKEKLTAFEKTVEKLVEFLQIFKSDLQGIEIDKKEKPYSYQCSLIMKYPSYRIHAEFESTGIKKLIKLFAYLTKMVKGSIVFVDELDSNLHDVYLCALLEYLMEYGKGQLCFTTHNVGPMDILKQNKKSIDFLSANHKIYPWKTNGNYSPSKLYRNGMIEGSPFNVDSTRFIKAFHFGEEE